jgi:hypothetical protein
VTVLEVDLSRVEGELRKSEADLSEARATSAGLRVEVTSLRGDKEVSSSSGISAAAAAAAMRGGTTALPCISCSYCCSHHCQLLDAILLRCRTPIA